MSGAGRSVVGGPNKTKTTKAKQTAVPCMDKTDEELASRKFMVLYNHMCSNEHFAKAHAGDIVTLMGMERAEEFGWKEKVPLVERTMCASKQVTHSAGYKGIMAPYFMKKAESSRDGMIKKHPLIFAKWYLGEVTPIKAAALLRERWLDKFAFVVCSPPEYQRDREWPELLLCVRMYTGLEYKQQEHNKMMTVTEPKPRCDRLPGDSAPMPVYAAIRIRRTATGQYLMADQNREFNSVLEMIGHYMNKSILIDMEQQPTLKLNDQARLPPPAHPGPLKPADMPAPPVHPRPAPKITIPWKDGQTFNPAFAMKPDDNLRMIESAKSPETSGVFGSKYSCDATTKNMKGQIKNHQVTVLVLGGQLFPDKLFSAYHRVRDAKRVMHPERKYPCTDYIGRYFLVTKHINRTLVISEFYEASLWQVLRRRLQAKDKLSVRSLLEVLYQVVAAMRSLEDLHLYHGTLAPAQVMVVEEWRNSMRVRVVDYYVYARLLATHDNRKKLEPRLFRRWSPQMLLGKCNTRSSMIEADVWAFGVLLYEVLTHCEMEAFKQFDTPADLLKHLESPAQRLASFDMAQAQMLVQPDLYEMIGSCLRWRPSERLRFDQLFDFFNDLLYDAVSGPSKAILDHRPDLGPDLGPEHKSNHTKTQIDTKSCSSEVHTQRSADKDD